MNKDDIMRMAREAGFMPTVLNHWPSELERFANLVAAHKAEVALAEAYRCGYEAGVAAEREACAKVCDDLIGTRAMAVHCADAIRARGTT